MFNEFISHWYYIINLWWWLQTSYQTTDDTLKASNKREILYCENEEYSDKFIYRTGKFNGGQEKLLHNYIMMVISLITDVAVHTFASCMQFLWYVFIWRQGHWPKFKYTNNCTVPV